MTKSYKSAVLAVVVTYEPDLQTLEQLLKVLVVQVDAIMVVDNGSQVNLQIWINEHKLSTINLIALIENKGIAAAHNVGIEWANNYGADFVLLMDQDSVPAPNMVPVLIYAFLEADQKKGCFKPIAAGPMCVDSRTNKRSFFVIEQHGMPSRWRSNTNLLPNNFSHEVSFLISSGSLINLKALQSVGGMRSNYFIDHVDTEWCFRARANGYVLLGVPNAQMQHTMGDKVKNIWFFGWRQVAYHSPLRDYYMFRNTLLMFRDVKMSIFWQLYLLWRLIQFSSYFLIFVNQRSQRFYCMTLGIVHGVRGISGKFDLKTGQCTQIPESDLDT